MEAVVDVWRGVFWRGRRQSRHSISWVNEMRALNIPLLLRLLCRPYTFYLLRSHDMITRRVYLTPVHIKIPLCKNPHTFFFVYSGKICSLGFLSPEPPPLLLLLLLLLYEFQLGKRNSICCTKAFGWQGWHGNVNWKDDFPSVPLILWRRALSNHYKMVGPAVVLRDTKSVVEWWFYWISLAFSQPQIELCGVGDREG